MTRTEEAQLRRFASMLGWSSLKKYRHVIRDSSAGVPLGTVITWYESGDFNRVLFQVNMTPSLHAAVFATRFRVCTGWHKFRLSSKATDLRKEAERLRDWFAHDRFVTAEGRRKFRKQHPECAGYTVKRLRTAGPPYEYVTTKDAP